MSNNSFSEKKWKYLSFALIGILAVGSTVSFLPQASAHVTTNVQHMLEHIYNFVDGIEAKTNNLPADPASTTDVVTKTYGTQVVSMRVDVNSNSDGIAVSDRDYTVCYIFAALDGAPDSRMQIFLEGQSGTIISPGAGSSGCLGGDADQAVSFNHIEGPSMTGLVTVTTNDEATVTVQRVT